MTFSGNTGTPEIFPYSPMVRSSIWDLKYTFTAGGIMIWLLRNYNFGLQGARNVSEINKKARSLFRRWYVQKTDKNIYLYIFSRNGPKT